MGMTRSVRVGDCYYPGSALGTGARNDVQPVRTPRCTGRIMIKHSETAYNLVTKASKVWWREGASAEAIECPGAYFSSISLQAPSAVVVSRSPSCLACRNRGWCGRYLWCTST
jgi:hypothetical protein